MHDCDEENKQFASSFSGVLSFSSPGARDEERRTISIGKDLGNKMEQFAGLRKAGGDVIGVYETWDTEKCMLSVLTVVRISKGNFREYMSFCRDKRNCPLSTGVRIKRGPHRVEFHYMLL